MKYLIIFLAIIGGSIYAYYNPRIPGKTVVDNTRVEQLESPHKDTIDKLERVLQAKGSPLAVYAADIIKAEDRYKLPFGTLTGIMGQESSYGKHYKSNPWNWGHCDSCDRGITFPSIAAASDAVGKGIATGRYYRTYQKTKKCEDLADVYLSGEIDPETGKNIGRIRWCGMIASVSEELK